jgi:beta-N-acetylhexosaminidase
VSTELYRLANGLLQPGFAGTTVPDWLRRALQEGLGGVLLWDRNVASADQLATLTSAMLTENPDAIVAIDEEGGDVTRLETERGSSWPGNWALGVVDDVGVTYAVARQIGRDLAALGINLNYGPVADVNRNPDNPVIGVRAFGATPDHVATHTAAYVSGLQSTGVAACAKHFPGHGDTAVDSHLGLPVVADTEDALAGALLPFRAAIKADVQAIMSAHIVLPAYGDVPATINRRILTGLLREELRFDGLIVTDAIEMAAIKATYGLAEGAVRAVAAGADVICIGGWRDAEHTHALLRDSLVAAVGAGRLSEERLAEAATRRHRLATSARRDQGELPGDRIVGLDAARRALRITGALLPLAAPAHVVELAPVVNAQIGPRTTWGIAAALTGVLPGTTSQRLMEPCPDLDALLAPAAGRPLVVAVRDAHRHAWATSVLANLVAARPDAVVVEMGLPHLRAGEPCRYIGTHGCYIATHGASRASGIAVAELLTGHSRC